MAKNLQQIKDEVAKEQGFDSFIQMQFKDLVCEEDIDKIAKLEEAAELGIVIIHKQAILNLREEV